MEKRVSAPAHATENRAFRKKMTAFMQTESTVHKNLDYSGRFQEKQRKVRQKVNNVLKYAHENSDKNKQDFGGVFVRRVKNV